MFTYTPLAMVLSFHLSAMLRLPVKEVKIQISLTLL